MSYYTPSIEEFHVGFEYQELEFIYTDKGWYTSKEQKWINKVFEATNYMESYYLTERVKRNLYENSIRVKYLDKEDIESLGFKLGEFSQYKDSKYRKFSEVYTKFGTSGERLYGVTLFYGKQVDSTYIQIDGAFSPGAVYGHLGSVLFKGTIKNKPELKRLLKQLGINE